MINHSMIGKTNFFISNDFDIIKGRVTSVAWRNNELVSITLSYEIEGTQNQITINNLDELYDSGIDAGLVLKEKLETKIEKLQKKLDEIRPKLPRKELDELMDFYTKNRLMSGVNSVGTWNPIPPITSTP